MIERWDGGGIDGYVTVIDLLHQKYCNMHNELNI